MRLVNTYADPTRSLSAKVYYSNEDEEYVVKFYRNGVHLKKADYYTSDRRDATGTAKKVVEDSPKQSARI